MKILVINGPNLNFLGIRQPEIYGNKTYQDLIDELYQYAHDKNFILECFQSNHEGALIDRLQQAYFEKVDGIVFNPGAYTHTSIALLDALEAIKIKTVEVHLSDVTKRESFRNISYIRPACCKTIMGKGFKGYFEAIDFLLEGEI